jgi:hypothetical protein
MSVTGNATISIRKKDLEGSKPIAIGFKKLVFAHQAAAGETGISLTALTTPTDMASAGFVQPTANELSSAQVLFNRKNLTIISSAKGELIDYMSYRVASNNQINWEGFTTEEDEIFVCIVDHEPMTGLQTVDASPMQPATGTLSAGTTTISVGEAFEVAKYPSRQIGDVLVMLDGQTLLRNVGNATAAPGADGDYEEVDNGSGLGSDIEINVSKAFDRSYIVISNGLRVNRPDDSRDQALDSLAGQVDAMIPTLAVTAGVPESTFQAAPNNVDLKSFGDRVGKLERYRTVSAADTAVGPVDKILADTTGGVFTIDLPATPNAGDWVEVWDSEGNFGTSALTIGRNGNLIEGAAADFTISTGDVRVKLVYVSSSRGWIIGDMS